MICWTSDSRRLTSSPRIRRVPQPSWEALAANNLLTSLMQRPSCTRERDGAHGANVPYGYVSPLLHQRRLGIALGKEAEEDMTFMK